MGIGFNAQQTMLLPQTNMKITITLTLALALIATSLYASIIQPPYDNSKPPKMLLPVAYERATAALGSDTNQFHCVSATITTEFADGGWYFTFCSTNSKVMPKLIVVEFNGKVVFDNGFR
jgi:hypothetical protein